MDAKLFLTALIILLISGFLSFDRRRIEILSPSFSTKLSPDEMKRVVPIVGAVGPESFAFDPHGGGPYTGVSDGRIIKWVDDERRWIDFAVTSPLRDGCGGPQAHEETEHVCGRPLGLRFNEATGDLYIADAYMGLLVVGPEGGLATKVATEAQGIPFRLTNGVDIDQRSGIVYFSDSSSRYSRRNYISLIASGDKTGRLMKYDPQSKQTTVLLNNLAFPNGVALSKDGSFILVAETTSCRILKLRLETTSSSMPGKIEEFARLPGFPDNIKRNPKGDFWVAIHARRGKFLGWVLSLPWAGNALVKLPFDITKVYSWFAKWGGRGAGVRLSEVGDVLEVWEGERNGWKGEVSEVDERGGSLWIGSIRMPFVGIQERESLVRN